jgi:hypothetical protein
MPQQLGATGTYPDSLLPSFANDLVRAVHAFTSVAQARPANPDSK